MPDDGNPMPDFRSLTDRLTERGQIAEQESRFGDSSDMQDACAEIDQLRTQLENERAAHAVACQMWDEAMAENERLLAAASTFLNEQTAENAEALRRAVEQRGNPDKCARCGFPQKEHSHAGACYGLCGKFEQS